MSESPSWHTSQEAAQDPEFVGRDLAMEQRLLAPHEMPSAPESEQDYADTVIVLLGERQLRIDDRVDIDLEEGRQTYVANNLIYGSRRAGDQIYMYDLVPFWHQLKDHAKKEYEFAAQQCADVLNGVYGPDSIFLCERFSAGMVFTPQRNVDVRVAESYDTCKDSAASKIPIDIGTIRQAHMLLRNHNEGAIRFYMDDGDALAIDADKYRSQEVTFVDYIYNSELLVHYDDEWGSYVQDRQVGHQLQDNLRRVHKGNSLIERVMCQGLSVEQAVAHLEAIPYRRSTLIEAAVSYEKIRLAKRHAVLQAMGGRISAKAAQHYRQYDQVLCDAIDMFDTTQQSISFDAYLQRKLRQHSMRSQ
jgi:hypothetical protein